MRPGSIVSNLEQRLDDIDVFGGEGDGEPPHREHHRKHRANADGDGQGAHDAGANSSTFHALAGNAEQQYLALMQQMQYRELTPADLQLLRQLEEQRSNGSCDPSPPGCSVRGSASAAGSSSGGAGGGSGSVTPPPGAPPALRANDGGKRRAGGSGGTGGGGGSTGSGGPGSDAGER